MSTHKWIDRVCVLAVVVAMLITVLFMNGEALGIQAAATVMGYEDRLFDNSKVHTIDIRIDDWDAFLSTAQSEVYSVCDVIIDGEPINNVGIRGKGNTSLSSVSTMGSQRYSFKIEFDQYDSTQSYYGLDKMSLNNLIQDNTMMKDYLTYTMMAEFGAASPLCSFVYITVNGEDWGLYLAVEAVEESFLQRNYGQNYGELYKPDSLAMGGGRGNGQEFDFNDLMGGDSAVMPEDFANGGAQMPDTSSSSGGETATMPEGADPGQMGQQPDMSGSGGGETATMPEGADPGQMGQQPDMSGSGGGETATMPEGVDPGQMGQQPDMSGSGGGEGGGADIFGGMGFGMGSSDVKLQYVDDDPSSYSTIFNSAKTDIDEADQTRLIEALKTMNSGDTSAVDVDSVMRYFVVHNYVVNGDSYTGSMVHNYYLYEEDGVLAMIPWDYNLAFGTFQGGDATGTVNDSIDQPLSAGSDRPMFAWITGSEETLQAYHDLYREFLDTVDPVQIIQDAYELIAPYVKQDPTKFCTAAEFATGVTNLETFCQLRSESIELQLAGEDRQVDASSLDISAMGTMGGTGGMPGGNDTSSSGGGETEQTPQGGDDSGNGGADATIPQEDASSSNGGESATMPQGGTESSNGGESATLPQGGTESSNGGESATMPQGGTESSNGGESATMPQGGTESSNGGESATMPQEDASSSNGGESATLPQGGTESSNGGESATLPQEGTDPSGSGSMNLSQQIPDATGSGMQFPTGEALEGVTGWTGENGSRVPSGSGTFPGSAASGQTGAFDTEQLILVVASAMVLLIGLLVTVLFKRY